MVKLLDSFTSTGAKFFAHQEAMKDLKNGKGHPITTHLMLTDVCNHSCAFCSVQAREGDSLPFDDICNYLDILLKYGLKSTILSGGGNPILYRCKKSGRGFDDVINAISSRGLEIGLITNGMPLCDYDVDPSTQIGGHSADHVRRSWKTVSPESLDKMMWIRISMSGFDHHEREVYVPDIDPRKTTLGFSYVAHDIYREPLDPHHGKVSRTLDLISEPRDREPTIYFEERIPELTSHFKKYVKKYKPNYLRLLPNCLEPDLIPARCSQLQKIANIVNFHADEEVVFVQNKPPKAPKVCYLGYIHPVLTPSGYVMPCDSHCLNESAEHKLGGEPWRICHWTEIDKLYENPVRSLIEDPSKTCPGCVFSKTNDLLQLVYEGKIDTTPSNTTPHHVNFV